MLPDEPRVAEELLLRREAERKLRECEAENARLAAEVERLRRMAECWKFWEPGDRFYHAKDQTWWKCEDQEHLKRAEPPVLARLLAALEGKTNV